MTKEELKNQIIDIERGARILAEGTHCDKKYVVARIMQKTYAIQRKFNRYIDVLEPLRQHPCFYAIKNFMEQIEDEFLTVEHSVEWTIIAGIISRSVALLEKEKEPTHKYCPHCGKEIE